MDRLRLGLCRVVFAPWQVKDRLEHPDAAEGFILVRMHVSLLVTVVYRRCVTYSSWLLDLSVSPPRFYCLLL